MQQRRPMRQSTHKRNAASARVSGHDTRLKTRRSPKKQQSPKKSRRHRVSSRRRAPPLPACVRTGLEQSTMNVESFFFAALVVGAIFLLSVDELEHLDARRATALAMKRSLYEMARRENPHAGVFSLLLPSRGSVLFSFFFFASKQTAAHAVHLHRRATLRRGLRPRRHARQRHVRC